MQRHPNTHMFFPWWLISTILGFAIGPAILIFTTGTVEQAVVLSGLLGGMAQWLVLKRWLTKAYRWLFATYLGLGLGGSLGFVVAVLCLLMGIGTAGMVSPGIGMPGFFLAAIFLAVAGTVLGWSQWLMLKGQIRDAGFWIIGTLWGWLIGGMVGLVLAFNLPTLNTLGDGAVGFVLVMAISIFSTTGVITGAGLAFALNQRDAIPPRH